jgi:hypothetical protein
VEAEADWPHLRTPETYLGTARGERFDSSGDAAGLRLNHWRLQGEWSRRLESVALQRAGGSIAFRFHARDAHLVLFVGTSGPIPFRVLLDEQPPGAAHGVDVDANGHGELREGRMYQLVSVPDAVRERTLRVVFDGPDAEAYAFTFG